MRCILRGKIARAMVGLAAFATLVISNSRFVAAVDAPLRSRKGLVTTEGAESRGGIRLVSNWRRNEYDYDCGCRGCCLKHTWAPYYCGLESYHRPYLGEPGWREWWKAEKCWGQSHDMRCYTRPSQSGWGGSW